MAGPGIGYATLQVIPSTKGFGSAMAKQITAPLKSASDGAGKESGESFMSGFAGKAKMLAVGAGALVGGALAKGFTDFIANDAAIDKTAAAFGLDAETSARLGDAAGRIYADAYGESLGEVSNAIALVQQGLGSFDTPIAELEQMTVHALDFATAFDTDVNEAITAASLLVKNGLAKDGVEAFDLLTIASQQLAPAMREELIAATQEYSTFFASLGLTGEETFTGLVRAAERGGNYGVDKFGDAMKELTIRSSDWSTGMIEGFESAGLDAKDMAERFVAGGDTARGALDDLVEGLLDIKDPVQQANAAIGLFGAPLEDLSVAEIPNFLRGMQDLTGGLGEVSGSAAAMGDTLNDNAAVKIEAFKRNALMTLSDFVGNTLIPNMEGLAAAWGDGGLAGAASYLGEKLPFIEGPLGAISDWWTTNGEAVKTGFSNLATAVGALVTGGFDLLSAWWDANGEAITTGLTTVGTVVAETLTAALSGLYNVLKDDVLPWLGNLYDWFTENESRMVGALAAITAGFAAWAFAAAAAAASTIAAIAAAAVAAAPFGLLAVAVGFVAAALHHVWTETDNLQNAWLTFTQYVENLWNWLNNVWDMLGKILERMEEVGDKINEGFGGTIGAADSFGDAINDQIRGIFGFDTGGVVPGRIGEPQLALVHGGETILPTHKQDFSLSASAVGGAPLVGGDYIVQVLPGEDKGRRGVQELRRLQYLGTGG